MPFGVVGALLVTTVLAVAIRDDFPNQFPKYLNDSLYWGGVGFFVLATVLAVSSGVLYMIKYWSLFKGEKEERNV